MLKQMLSALSVTPVCPRCKGVIPSQDVNVANDVAFCRHCNLAHTLSALTSGTVVDDNVDLSRPPNGTWFQRDAEGTIVGATHRSLGQAFGLLVFSLFWNGIVSFFVLIALASTLHLFGLPVPGWLPAAFSKQSHLPVPFILFLWLFLTPFIGVGLLVFSTCLRALAGCTEIRIQQSQGFLLCGVGPLRFRKRFDPRSVRDIRIDDRRWRDSDGDSRSSTRILLDVDPKPLTFGSMLTRERRQFLAGALKKELVRG